MQSTECIPERNHDGLASRACEGHLQVSAVLELSAELAKLIGDSVYDLTLHVRENDAVPAGLGLQLNIDLKWVRAIKHLPCDSACRSSSFENRLQKTVEENFDAAACSLSLTRQIGSCKRCLGDSDGVLGRLVICFRSR